MEYSTIGNSFGGTCDIFSTCNLLLSSHLGEQKHNMYASQSMKLISTCGTSYSQILCQAVRGMDDTLGDLRFTQNERLPHICRKKMQMYCLTLLLISTQILKTTKSPWQKKL